MSKENSVSLPPYVQPAVDENGSRLGQIIRLRAPEQITGMAIPERVVGRKILRWSQSCGTYGQGGPGFFGLKLESNNRLPEEWLILTLWGGADWLELNGRWIGAHPNQYHLQIPLYSDYEGGPARDEVEPFLQGKKIKKFEVEKTSALLEVKGAKILLHEDPTRRPLTGGSKELRQLKDVDDLRNAWIISPIPWVEI